MKPKYLFLLKFLGYSLALFSFGRICLTGYISALSFLVAAVIPQYQFPHEAGNFIHLSSITIIAYVSLILSTPNIPLWKRAGFIIIGLVVFLWIDVYGIARIVFPGGLPCPDENSPVRELYLSSKWFMPFLLWMVLCYPYLGELLGMQNKVVDSN